MQTSRGSKNYEVNPEIQADLTALYQGQRNIQAGFRNRAFTSGSATVPTPVTAAMDLFFAGALLVAKSSGIFDVKMKVQWSGAMTGDTGVFKVFSQDNAANNPITFAGATAVGVPGVLTSPPVCFVSSAAGGITLSAGGGVGLTPDTTTIPALTGILQGEYTWSGTLYNSLATAPASPGWAAGHFALIMFSLNATHQWTLGAVSLSVIELPA